MQDSVLSELEFPLAVVTFDAGAANVIFAWLEEWNLLNGSNERNVSVLSRGPSVLLSKNFSMGSLKLGSSIKEVLSKARTLIAGTGWSSSTEVEALKHAKDMGIHTISVVDHWVNYKQRFLYSGEEIYPSEVWVTDHYAKALADQVFTNCSVALKPNTYMTRSRSLVLERRDVIHHPPCRFLYVLEPIRDGWSKSGQLGEFEALDYFLTRLNQITPSKQIEVRLRPHPSDFKGKYEAWVKKDALIDISLDTSSSIESSIAWADAVVGCHSMAMVIALHAGRNVISSLPPWAPKSPIPFKEITELRNLL